MLLTRTVMVVRLDIIIYYINGTNGNDAVGFLDRHGRDAASTEVRDQSGGVFGPGPRAEGGVRNQRGEDGRQLGDPAELPLGSTSC